MNKKKEAMVRIVKSQTTHSLAGGDHPSEGRGRYLDDPYPDQAARVVISLFEDLGYATVELLFSGERLLDDLPRLERIIEAWVDALERVLGAPAGCLRRASREELSQWLAPPSGKPEHLPGDTAAGKQSFTELMDKVKESE